MIKFFIYIQYMLELGSVEFFDKYYPTAKQNTKDGVSRLIANLNNWRDANPNKDLGLWIDEKTDNTHRWKERFLFLRKFNEVYWTFNLKQYNNQYVKLMADLNMGKNVNVKTTSTDEHLLSEFARLDSLFKSHKTGMVTIESLFGCWLPPRRMDVYKLVIRDSDTTDPINYYNQSTNEFVFRDYKNSKTKSVQRFSIMSLVPLYSDPKELFKVIEFLNSRPLGVLYKWAEKSLDALINKWYGCNNTTMRKYWETKYHNGTKSQQLCLSQWMDHSIDTALRNYVVEPSIPYVDMVLETSDMVLETSDWSDIVESSKIALVPIRSKVN